MQSTYNEERFILTHSLRGFDPWSFSSIALGPVVRQNITVRSGWQSSQKAWVVGFP
jgi:hypothetical protein